MKHDGVKSNPNWGSIRIRRDLIDRIAVILKTKEAKNRGYTNIAQFTDVALRNAVRDLERRFSHINMYEDHVKILDSQLDGKGRILSVYFKRDGKPYCDYCEETDCTHVQYAWELPEARKVLEGYGLQPPTSRQAH